MPPYVTTLCVLIALWLLPGVVQGQPADLEQATKQARRLLDEGKFAEAIPLLVELRKAAPENTSLAMTIGQAYANTGEFQKAILEYDAVRRRLPNFKPAVVSLATLYLNLGRGREGVALLSEFVARNPGDADTRTMLASVYQAQGDLSRANEHLAETVRLQPRNPQVWFALYQNLNAIVSECMALTEQADPESAPMVAMAGLERVQLQQDESAFYLLRESLRRNPKLRAVHSQIAAIYKRREQLQWAEEEESRELALGSPDCGREVAACAFLAGKYAEVMTATRFARLPEDLYWRYRAAVELANEAFGKLQSLPASVQSQGARAEWLRKRNRHGEAVKAWQAAIALAPNNPGLRKELVVSLMQAKEFAQSAREADALLKDAPADPELLVLRGDAALNQQNAAQALPFLQRALQAEPDMLPAHASLGRALLQLNRASEAIPHLEKALPYAPDGQVLYQLSQAYQQAGKGAEAAQALARYQEIQRREQQERVDFEARFQITPP